MQNLKLNYKNRLTIGVTEAEVERLLDAKNALRSIGLEIVERQQEYSVGNKVDILCKDFKNDLVVVELKKHGPNETIGQLARYVTDVRERVAKPSQKVRGLILAFDVDEQLIKAARGVDFDVMLYQIAIQ
jgi:RecB family endonuclease NucS